MVDADVETLYSNPKCQAAPKKIYPCEVLLGFANPSYQNYDAIS